MMPVTDSHDDESSGRDLFNYCLYFLEAEFWIGMVPLRLRIAARLLLK
jgi:hypothetical protein